MDYGDDIGSYFGNSCLVIGSNLEINMRETGMVMNDVKSEERIGERIQAEMLLDIRDILKTLNEYLEYAKEEYIRIGSLPAED